MSDDVKDRQRPSSRDAPRAGPDVAMTKQSALPAEELARLTDGIVAALKTVYDPEIPSDIYELGLIYKVDIADDRAVTIDMTLTTPNCPSAQELPQMVENAVAQRARRRRGEGQHRLGPAVGPEPDDRRGAGGAQMW